MPHSFRTCAFSRDAAIAGGIPARVLEGRQFIRIHKGVYRHRDHELAWVDHVTAARLALPAGAVTTGITRIQELGIDFGPRSPLHFVVEGDLHLVLEGVFLHRTVLMPPHDGRGVSVEAAFVAYCAEARVLDAIKVGSLLLRLDQMGAQALEDLVTTQLWRRGALEARWVLPHLDGRCRSLPEAELLAFVRFSGLPEPDVNRALELGPLDILTPDIWFRSPELAVEYQGSHHQTDRAQYTSDIDRHARYRKHAIPYLEITKERVRSPKATVRLIHGELVAAGYDGPLPVFGQLWDTLFRPLPELVHPDRLSSADTGVRVGA